MKLITRKSLFLFSLSLISCVATYGIETAPPHSHPPIFVFDLNGVLFDTDTIKVVRQIGIKDALWYLAQYRSTRMFQNRFYETLHRIAQRYPTLIPIKDPDGTIMPQLMVEWLRGTHANKLLLERIVTAINKNPDWFFNATEQRIMAAMARAIFDPEQFVASRKHLPDLIPLIIQLKNRGAKLYILSNWDKESFALLKKRFPEVFRLFDDHIISGEVGHLKPEPEIFIHTHTKTPHFHICFLDDQQDNLEAGKQANWYTILVNKTASYFGTQSTIDIDTITRHALHFLENHHLLFPSPLSLAENKEHSLPEKLYAAN